MADRLTDAELEAMHNKFVRWVESDTAIALSELIERRAMDAELLNMIRDAKSDLASEDEVMRARGHRSLNQAINMLKESA